MSIKQKLALHFVLHHTPTFADFFGPVGMGKFCRTRLYQKPAMLSKGGALQGGRRWGKTFTVIWKSVQGIFRFPRSEQLITTLRQVHRDNIWNEIEKIIFSVRLFKEYLLTGQTRGSIRYNPINEAKFKNGHIIYGIGVGDDPHASQIKGKSPKIKYVDEAQVYPQRAATGLASTMDPSGCEEWWAGVVDGRRDTPFFAVLEKSLSFRNKIFKFSRRLDPHFCQKDLQELAEQIEGGEMGDRFGQEVDAEHGNPIAAVWNIDDVMACMARQDPGDTEPKTIYPDKEIIITPRDYSMGDDLTFMFRNLYRSTASVVIGIDPGDAEPTMILPFVKENEEPWTLRNIVQMRDHVDTVAQVEILEYLLAQYPNKVAIGIDCTNSPAIADMLSSKSRELKDIIVRVFFNKAIIYDFEYIRDEEQVARHYQETGKKVKVGDNVERKAKAKNFSTEQARRRLAKREILFYWHPRLVEDFTAETARRGQSGTVIETPSNVHIPEALRCAAMAWWEKLDDSPKPWREPLAKIWPEVVSTGYWGREKNRMRRTVGDYFK